VDFSLCHNIDALFWDSFSLLSNAYSALRTAVVNRPGCEVDQSLPFRAEVKTAWMYNSTPPYVFMTWCLIEHRDCFKFAMNLPGYHTILSETSNKRESNVKVNVLIA
jgi:hypothetical protein